MFFPKLKRGVDFLSEKVGKIVSWITLLLIVIICFEVTMRHFFNLPTLWVFPVSIMLGAALYALAQCYTMKHGSNVRVDVIYNKFSPKTRRWFDMVFDIIFFLPVYSVLTYNMWERFIYSVQIHEKDVSSPLYLPTWPSRLAIAIGFSLLLLQFVINFISRFMKNREEVTTDVRS